MRRIVLTFGLASILLLVPVRAFAQTDSIRSDDDIRMVPVLRFALGPSLNFTPESHAEVALETTLGVSALQGIVGGVALNAEGGYTYESGWKSGTLHAGNLTLGVGWGALGMAITYQPRLILGTYAGDLAVGMRNGVTVHLFADLASVELGHQFVSAQADGDPATKELRHDVRMLIGLNPAAFVYLLTEAADAL